MSLATNTRIQMGKRLLQDLQLAVPQFSYLNTQYVDGDGAYDSIITISDPATPFTPYSFVVTSANASAGAVYSNNGHSFVVGSTIAAGTALSFSNGSGAPLASGTLTLVSGTGDATITFSAFSAFSPAPATVAVIALVAKRFHGFNVVAELSHNAAVGLPETDCFVASNTSEASYNFDTAGKINHEVFRLGAACNQMINQSAQSTSLGLMALIFPGYTSQSIPKDASYVNVTSTIANDARLGAVGA